jgi:hypothetical protein
MGVVGLLGAVGGATAQPTLTMDRDVVTPGSAVSAAISGVPGYYFALLGSTVGAGAVHAGVPLAVGSC